MNDVTLREQPMHGARHIWAEVQADLKSLLGDNAHRSWTARLSLHSANDSVVRLIAPSKFAAGRIVNDYGQTIQTLWAARDPRQVIVGLAADFADANTAPKPGLSVAAQSEAPKPADDIASPDLQIASPQPLSAAGRLRDARTGRFTFDNFVVGATNELAFAVARKVVESQSGEYNPVVIHGPHGMGKTHLLHAVKNQIEREDPERRVHMISSEQFVASFVTSVRGAGRDAIETFKRSVRDVDLLIIDDAHFIADKPGSQEELLHTLISLVGDGRQVMLATDRHPHAITKASDRLKSYMCAGLLCDIGPADYDLRRRILDRLIEGKRMSGTPHLAMPGA